MGKKKERIRELELENEALYQGICRAQEDLVRTQNQLKAATDPARLSANQATKEQLYNEGFRVGKLEAKDDFIYWMGVVLGTYPTKDYGMEEMKADIAALIDKANKVVT